MKPLLLITASLLLTLASPAKLISKAVARVKSEIMTTRDVEINYIAERVLFSKQKMKDIKKLSSTSKKFPQAVSDLVLETVTHYESKLFPVIKITSSEKRKALSLLKALGKVSPSWRSLGVTHKEVEQLVARKLLSKKFINFKAESSDVPITEREAKDYFEQNKLKFGSLPYENFAKEIKAHLAYEQKKTRLKDWFEILHAKYKVKRFLY